MLVGWISSQQNRVWSTSRSCVHGSQRLTLTIDLSGSIRGGGQGEKNDTEMHYRGM